ncbi:cytoplasmic tRNA 2-thiolation protein 2, putative [Plasmodium malariae]|uniref:Cytoplasmic tRNA 2-thiolation protein 2, putative n=1 Tax=Plasmodium malariae TaxID=5858 RepID=A0A1C3L1U2_PLAMA|nr:cytoplasmic tRNA 2-thiolation protein 2, putative [Plasmodium malariae]
MTEQDKKQEKLNYSDKEKINTVLCYKCKRNNAVVCTREKSCKDCFLHLVEYTFKNTLREKCLFKNKGRNDFQVEQEIAPESDNYKRDDISSTQFRDHVQVNADKIEYNYKKLNEEKCLNKTCEKEKKKVHNLSTQKKKKKKTAIAFSGEICSSFLLFSFVKYLENIKNRKNDFILMNEHCIFSEIIFVDIFNDENYIFHLIMTIENILHTLEKNKDIKGNKSKESNLKNYENGNSFSSTNNDKKILFIDGIFRKKISKIHFVVLKSNYFIKEKCKMEFTIYYDLVKNEKKNYYLNYINDIIIYSNILKYCINENIKCVLFGNNANNISNKSFLYTIFGNGINLPICTAYIDNRYKDIHFIKPLKDLLNKEIYIYCFYKNITYLHNTTFCENVLYRIINDMLSALDAMNNTTSIINKTTNNLINLMSCCNSRDQRIYDAMCHCVCKSSERKRGDSNTATGDVNSTAKDNDNGTDNGIAKGGANVTGNGTTKGDNVRSDEKIFYSKDVEEESSTIINYKYMKDFNNISACFICFGNKETVEETNFIKKLDKVQLSNIKKMKYSNFICSTCLCIFSSNNSFVNLFNVFFNI